jgi:hypothetical protein
MKDADPMLIPRSGPMTSDVQIPARSKPGRKPITDDDGNRRREQNRTAQRKFRDSRAEKLKVTQAELVKLRDAHVAEMAEWRRRWQDMEVNMAKLRSENEQLRIDLARYQSGNNDSQPNHSTRSNPNGRAPPGYATQTSFRPAVPPPVDFTTVSIATKPSDGKLVSLLTAI